MKTKTTTEFPLQAEIIALIQTEIQLHSVYVIGVNKERKKQKVYLAPQNISSKKKVIFTLLIITYKPISKNLDDFMDYLYHKMQKCCKIYPIIYTLSNVKKRLNYGDNFLIKTIFQTPCIYKKDDFLSKFSSYSLPAHQNVYDNILETWSSRMNRAEYLLSIINNIEPKENSISKLSILHHALEQVNMALLFVFWEFKPQYYSLPYLLHLCSQFSELPQTIFPKETYGVHRIYYMLCNAHHMIRFKVQNEFSNMDTDKAYNRCKWFYDEARSLGEAQLKHLKELHCKPFNL
jgi:hypothetical protein